MTCTIEGCGRPVRVKKRGWCSMHYRRWERHGDPNVTKAPRYRRSTCWVAGCDRRSERRGMCGTHHGRLVRHGDVFADVPIGGLRDVLAVPDPVADVCVDCDGEPWGGTIRCEPCLRADLAARVPRKPAESGRPSNRGGIRQVRLPRGVAA